MIFWFFSGQGIKEGTPGGGPTAKFYVLTLCNSVISPYSLLSLKCISLGFNGFANHNSTTPLFRLVNRASLDRILQFEVHVNEADGQLRATHLILGYTPDNAWMISGLKLSSTLPKVANKPWNQRQIKGDRWRPAKNPPMIKLVSVINFEGKVFYRSS